MQSVYPGLQSLYRGPPTAMGFSKKTGKGRLDKYYHLAKEQGYRARSAFKLVQLNKKYGFLQQSRVVIDLCAAPGGWCQVAAKYMPKSKLIIGVDLAPIKPISGVITMINDITTDKCRTDIRRELKDWKADVVLHDGAPNVGKAWLQDAYTQSELVLSSLKLATDFLIEGGWFITKVFRSKDYNSLMWVFNQLFTKVEATKPSSSRDVSAEIFVVCKGYKAPKTIDPRFLDPRSVFTDVDSLMNGGKNTSAKVNVLHPEKNRRHREGYDDDARILYKKVSVLDFILNDSFMELLAENNELSFTDIPEGKEDQMKLICVAPDTTEEIRACCQDLKVCGRREFKILIKWRLQMRKLFGIKEAKVLKAEAKAAQEASQELDSEEELEKLNTTLQKQAKREKKKRLERKAKLRMRLNLQMETANDLAQDAHELGLFSLKKVAKVSREVADAAALNVSVSDNESEDDEINVGSHRMSESEADSEVDSEEERFARMEASVVENVPVKKRSKRHDMTDNDDEDDGEALPETSLEEMAEDLPLDNEHNTELIAKLHKPDEEAALKSAKVALWYSNPIFQSMHEISRELTKHQQEKKTKKKNRSYQESPFEALKEEVQELAGKTEQNKPSSSSESQKSKDKKEPKAGAIEMVQVEDPYAQLFESGEIKDILNTAEGLTYAHRLADPDADRRDLREDMIDETFHRYAFGEKPSELPAWFREDESQHNKPIKPITREVADALKAQMKEINSRPVKKILEAKARGKARLVRKIESLKRKAENIMGNEEGAEKAKLIQVAKMLRNPKIKKEKPTLVIARGANKGRQGRPTGVRGRYKMVDARMKKELRAEKRRKLAAKNKKSKK